MQHFSTINLKDLKISIIIPVQMLVYLHLFIKALLPMRNLITLVRLQFKNIFYTNNASGDHDRTKSFRWQKPVILR